MREQAKRLYKLSQDPDFEIDRYTQRIDALEKAANKIEKENVKGLITKVLPKNKSVAKRGRANRYNFDNLIFVLSVVAEEFNKKSKL
jgi:endonuclease III-like uncharacterized protein